MPVDFRARGQSLAEPLFSERWSPRAFEKVAVPQDELDKIFDAARYSPSAFNVQPWRILASQSPEGPEFERFLKLLVDGNQVWARNASVLGFMLAAKKLDSGQQNRWACYDCGFAWAALTFQAARLGYYAHGMAGILIDKIYEEFAIPPESYEVIAGFALGKLASADSLPAALRQREFPQPRKKLSEVYFPGGTGLKPSAMP